MAFTSGCLRPMSVRVLVWLPVFYIPMLYISFSWSFDDRRWRSDYVRRVTETICSLKELGSVREKELSSKTNDSESTSESFFNSTSFPHQSPEHQNETMPDLGGRSSASSQPPPHNTGTVAAGVSRPYPTTEGKIRPYPTSVSNAPRPTTITTSRAALNALAHARSITGNHAASAEPQPFPAEPQPFFGIPAAPSRSSEASSNLLCCNRVKLCPWRELHDSCEFVLWFMRIPLPPLSSLLPHLPSIPPPTSPHLPPPPPPPPPSLPPPTPSPLHDSWNSP